MRWCHIYRTLEPRGNENNAYPSLEKHPSVTFITGIRALTEIIAGGASDRLNGHTPECFVDDGKEGVKSVTGRP